MLRPTQLNTPSPVALDDEIVAPEGPFKLFKDTPVTSEQSTNIVYASLGVTEDNLAEFTAGDYKTQPQWVNHAALINQVIDTGPGNDIPGVRGTVWGLDVPEGLVPVCDEREEA